MARTVDPEEREIDVLQRLLPLRGMDVLDLGCGEGRTARRIARTAASVLGVDPDAERIAVAQSGTAEDGSCPLRFVTEDAVTLDLPAARFDAVIFTRSL